MGLGKGVAQRNRATNARRTAPSSKARGGSTSNSPRTAAAAGSRATKGVAQGGMKPYHG